MKSLAGRLKAGKPWRAWKRYGDARGNVLAAGVGYFAFFSIFPAVALTFTVFGFILHGHPELLGPIADNINANLPGFVRDAQHPKGLIPVQAPGTGALTITGVIAFVSLVLAGMGWLGAVREGVRAIFGVKGSVGNLLTTKLRDLGVLATLGVGIGLSAVLTSVVGAGAGWLAELVGLSGDGWVLMLAGLAVSVLADTGLMLLLLRVLSDVPAPWRVLTQAALVGGVGFSLLKLSATTLLPRLSGNPLFASIAIVVGLLVWLNLIARLTLIAAAWAANDVDAIQGPADTARLPGQSGQSGQSGQPAQLAQLTIRGTSLPTFGRAGDRATLAAGVVLGAAVTAGLGALLRGVRSAARLVRG